MVKLIKQIFENPKGEAQLYNNSRCLTLTISRNNLIWVALRFCSVSERIVPFYIMYSMERDSLDFVGEMVPHSLYVGKLGVSIVT